MNEKLTEEEKVQNGERIKKAIEDFEKLINSTTDISQLSGFLSYLKDARQQIIEDEGVTFDPNEIAIYTKPKNYTHGYIMYILSEIHRLMNIVSNKMKKYDAGNFNINSINIELEKIATSVEQSYDIDELTGYKLLLEQVELNINLIRNNLSENELNGVLFRCREIYSRLVAKINFVDGLEEDIRGINR